MALAFLAEYLDAGMAEDAALDGLFGLVLGATGHAFGWPVVRGGSGALASLLRWLVHLQHHVF